MAVTTFPTAAPFLPNDRSIGSLQKAAAVCRGCDLYKSATQTVFGEGPPDAELVLVGEQPGDREDRQGHPFVGPAGGVLDRALSDIGLARDKVYLTNAVKHFKRSSKGKRRIHETPRSSEVRACLPWLEAELQTVRPRLTVCMGATAVQSVLGPGVRVMADRGRVIESTLGPCLVTVHPSSVLRADPEERQAAYSALVDDLKEGVAFLARTGT
jgi:DNA polymerase